MDLGRCFTTDYIISISLTVSMCNFTTDYIISISLIDSIFNLNLTFIQNVIKSAIVKLPNNDIPEDLVKIYSFKKF